MTDREKVKERVRNAFANAAWHHALDPTEYVAEMLADELTIVPDNNVGKWIPVTERLPEESGSYLVATERGGVFITHYSKRGQRFSVSRMGSDVTHWQDRPMPPKEED